VGHAVTGSATILHVQFTGATGSMSNKQGLQPEQEPFHHRGSWMSACHSASVSQCKPNLAHNECPQQGFRWWS